MVLICRTCLLENEENELESIFTEKLVGLEKLTLSEMVSLCTGIEISKRDKFSNYICKQCVIKVIIAFKYRKKCWQTQNILLKIQAQENKVANTIVEEAIELNDADNLVSSMDGKIMPEIETVYVPETTPKSYLDTNLRPKRDLDLIQYMKISDDDLSNGRPIVCNLCFTSYKRIGHLRSHLGKVHKIAGIINFKCHICEKSFTSAEILKNHIKIHTKSDVTEICQYCGKQFNRAILLDIHLRRHRGLKPFLCEHCDYQAITASDMSIHKRSHSGEKPFKCHLCPAAYKTPSHRANHLRSHSDERPYKCSLCSTSYKTRNTYRNHMNLHDPAKSMTCEICKRVFKSRKNLRGHMAQHGAKQFKCTMCENVAFYLKSGLTYHMKIVHRINESET